MLKRDAMKKSTFVLSAASGTGKTSLLKSAAKQIPTLRTAISHTTRLPREGEAHAQDYYFVSEQEFEVMAAQGKFLEHAKVFGFRYGTSRQEVTRAQKEGKILVMEIDCQGALQIKKALGDEVTMIFILPPALKVLRERLVKRGKDSIKTIERRLQEAENEIAQAHHFDTHIVNDDFAVAVSELVRTLK